MAQATDLEKWEENAKGCFLTVVAFSVFGTICFLGILPRVNVHLGIAIILMVVMFAMGIFAAGAGVCGLMAAAILYYKHRVVSWRGFTAGLIAVVFLVVFR